MEKRLLFYLKYLEQLSNNYPNGELSNDEELSGRILTQIGFFQHERFIHLIVTITFALLTVISLYGGFLTDTPSVYLLTLLLVVLLVPYIRHYYILENGVQKMYAYYDILFDPWNKSGDDTES